MSEGGLAPESKSVVKDGTEKGFDILNKTIPLPDLEINFPNSEDLPVGPKYRTRHDNLLNPGIGPTQRRANADYLEGVRERKAQEIINELRRRGYKKNLLFRSLGRFYDEKTPPIEGIMNFIEVQDLKKGKSDIVFFMKYAVDYRLIHNAELTDGDYYPEETKQEWLKRPVAVMVADKTKCIRISHPSSDRYEWEINPDAVIAIFTFHIDDPLVRDSLK